MKTVHDLKLHYQLHDLIMKELITGDGEYDKLSKEDLFKLLDSVIGEIKIDLNYIIGDSK